MRVGISFLNSSHTLQNKHCPEIELISACMRLMDFSRRNFYVALSSFLDLIWTTMEVLPFNCSLRGYRGCVSVLEIVFVGQCEVFVLIMYIFFPPWPQSS